MKKSFTLIELLVVITIINLISSILFSTINTARKNARDVRRLTDIRQLQIALEEYKGITGSYPISLNCGAASPNGVWCNSVQSFANGRWMKDNGVANILAQTSLIRDPTDPKQGNTAPFPPLNGGAYFYYSYGYPVPNGTGKWYMIVFGLEDTSHPLQQQDGVRSCDGQSWHYGNGTNGIITLGFSCQQ